MTAPDRWPELRYDAYRDTKDTLHMYAQIVGKLRLALKPPLSQWSHALLQLSARGLTTGPLWVGDGTLSATLDLVSHEARFERSDGREARVKLGEPVADFYRQVTRTLDQLGAGVRINPMPQEVAEPIAFDRDTVHATYDRAQVELIWQALSRVGSVYEQAQTGYWGKQSQVGFAWGGFDLSVSKYSGRPAAAPVGVPQIMAGSLDAESHSVIFTLGNDQMPQAAFIGTAFPPPRGLEGAQVRPEQAKYVEMPGMGGAFLLAYDDVRASSDPRRALLEFCTSTYEAVASLGGWDRELLERRPPSVRQAA